MAAAAVLATPTVAPGITLDLLMLFSPCLQFSVQGKLANC